MNDTRSMRLTLVDAVIPGAGVLRDVLLIACFACATAVFSQISFWIGPVPLTGQTLAVLLSGAVLGSRRGALSQVSYLAVGATGLPFWFALGGPLGVARLIGPTAGYLFGFIAVAFVVGWLSERGWGGKIYKSVIAMLAGEVVLYACGLAWLAHFVSADKLLAAGLYPFAIGDLIKLLLAASLLPVGWVAVKRIKGLP
jgi:biotin transporter BioY